MAALTRMLRACRPRRGTAFARIACGTGVRKVGRLFCIVKYFKKGFRALATRMQSATCDRTQIAQGIHIIVPSGRAKTKS